MRASDAAIRELPALHSWASALLQATHSQPKVTLDVAHGPGERRSLGKDLDTQNSEFRPALSGWLGEIGLVLQPLSLHQLETLISKAHAPTTEPPGQGHTFISGNCTVMALAHHVAT